MSSEMALTDNNSGKETETMDCELANTAVSEDCALSRPEVEPIKSPSKELPEEESKEMEVDEGVVEDTKKATKRRASVLSDQIEDDFKGFDCSNIHDNTADFSKILDRMEADISAVSESFTPIRNVSTTPIQPKRIGRRVKSTAADRSRPSSALSAHSDGDGLDHSTDPPSSATSSPAAGRRRTNTEMSSPLLRIPLEKGWKRELVFRAALDQYSKRNADIYYYTPKGKKLRSTREVAEHLSGTGLTLDNFSFFKEPLGVDDPEKEIIRDAKLMRRVESPATPAPVVEGRRGVKHKPPKGATPPPPPRHTPTNHTTPAKIKVKSLGSRLSTSKTTPQQEKTKKTDNNNTTWKKPSGGRSDVSNMADFSAEHTHAQTHMHIQGVPPLRQQPCSMECGGGSVPSLACGMCLCLYHPQCVGAHGTDFICKNCGPVTPPQSNVQPAQTTPAPNRLTLKMKMSGKSGGAREWSVSPSVSGVTSQHIPPPTIPIQPTHIPIQPTPVQPKPVQPRGPQALVSLNGKSFILVPRCIPHEAFDRVRGRIPNGAASPQSPRPRSSTTDYFTQFCSKEETRPAVIQIFQYLGMRELAQCARVCKLWHEITSSSALWKYVRMKNSHVSDWAGLCGRLKRHGTKRLDLRKMLLPHNDTAFWESFAKHITLVKTLERLELCRCPSSVVEAVCNLATLTSLHAVSIRDSVLDPTGLGRLSKLTDLRLKSLSGLTLTQPLTPLTHLTQLTHLSLTSIKDLSCEIVGSLTKLESLELGECSFQASFGSVLTCLTSLRRLRLERGTAECAAPALLRALADLPKLTQLELVNFDVKVGFDEALASCKNIQRLLIIPTYVSQSATTNKQVLSGVLRLKESLTHLMWGVTIELLRVTELFIDQCNQDKSVKKKDIGECIPVLKPIPGCALPIDHHPALNGPPQVEILPLPTLQHLLSAQLPRTKLKLLRIPFHATWRQSLADFQ